MNLISFVFYEKLQFGNFKCDSFSNFCCIFCNSGIAYYRLASGYICLDSLVCSTYIFYLFDKKKVAYNVDFIIHGTWRRNWL